MEKFYEQFDSASTIVMKDGTTFTGAKNVGDMILGCCYEFTKQYNKELIRGIVGIIIGGIIIGVFISGAIIYRDKKRKSKKIEV